MYKIGRLRLYTCVIAILLLESGLSNIIDINGMRPNLMLIFVIFTGLNSDWTEALEAGIAAGLLRGVFTSGSVGISLVTLGLCGLFAASCRNKVYRESPLTQIALAFFTAVFFNALNLFVKTTVRNAELADVGIRHAVASMVLLVSLYTSFTAPPAFFCLKRLLRVREPAF